MKSVMVDEMSIRWSAIRSSAEWIALAKQAHLHRSTGGWVCGDYQRLTRGGNRTGNSLDVFLFTWKQPLEKNVQWG